MDQKAIFYQVNSMNISDFKQIVPCGFFFILKYLSIRHFEVRWRVWLNSVQALVRLIDSRLKKKQSTPIIFKTNYRREIKLIPIIMDYCLFQFDALKFFLGVVYMGISS